MLSTTAWLLQVTVLGLAIVAEADPKPGDLCDKATDKDADVEIAVGDLTIMHQMSCFQIRVLKRDPYWKVDVCSYPADPQVQPWSAFDTVQKITLDNNNVVYVMCQLAKPAEISQPPKAGDKCSEGINYELFTNKPFVLDAKPDVKISARYECVQVGSDDQYMWLYVACWEDGFANEAKKVGEEILIKRNRIKDIAKVVCDARNGPKLVGTDKVPDKPKSSTIDKPKNFMKVGNRAPKHPK